MVCPPPIRRYHSKVQLQRIRQGRNALGSTRILRDTHGLLPVLHIVTDPAGDERLCVEVIDWAFEEALHLGGVEVDGDDVVYARDVEEVGEHAGCDSATVGLLFRLAGVGEVWEDSYRHIISLCSVTQVRSALAVRVHRRKGSYTYQ